MYKALITDLDGTAVTLSSDGSDIDRDTQRSVRLALENDKKIACATGREWELAKAIVHKLGFTAPCIVEGGTRIVDPQTEKTIWEKHMDEGVPEKILSIFKSETSNGFVLHSSDISRHNLSDVDTVPSSLRFLYLLAVDNDEALRIASQINVGSDAVAHITPSWHGGELVDIHVVHPDATKQHAIQAWQTLEGVSKEETIGMGDSGNDTPIFLSSGYKVAVGNATPELKELADYIAPRVNEHALKHVIEKILLTTSK